jgi:hypothetical protein
LHILHYVPNFSNPTGGREIFVRGLIQHLQNYGIQQSVISNSEYGKVAITRYNNIDVFLLPVKKFGAYWIVKNIACFLKQSKCDVINIHGYGEYAGDLACIMKIIRHIKVPIV